MMKLLRCCIAFGLLALLGACASTSKVPAGLDVKAKTFTVTPGKANIYVYRNEFMGFAIPMQVNLNGQKAGFTNGKTYMAFEVNPGFQNVLSKAENDDSLVLNAEAGKSYYVWQEVKLGVLVARNKLHLVDEATGQKGVRECTMVDNALPSVGMGSQSVAAKSDAKPAAVAVAPAAVTTPLQDDMPEPAAPAKQAAPSKQAEPAPVQTAAEPALSSAPDQAERKLGKWSYVVEKLAHEQGCQGSGAWLLAERDGGQLYRVYCTNAKPFSAICSYGVCNPS
ncbi:DUF2846 domain-containing protein [Andreprevotia chitinilytica]|uniref:DUF2846 domain-containing protein n=1 Tax=Andreprevotia chitinilytica TaxID=396808 RepID=UPI000A03BB84|nr:DUF2846 domain-containing protein [Andreprevotia chitinilytica]